MAKNTEPKPIKYHMACGCFLYEQHLILKDNKKVCPHHGGRVVMRTRRCLDCDEVLILPARGKGPFRCKEHTLLHTRKQNNTLTKRANALKKKQKEVEKKKPTRVRSEADKVQRKLVRDRAYLAEKAKLKKQWSKHWRGDYCRFLPSCLLLKSLKCDGCKEFSPIFKGVDPGKRGCIPVESFLLKRRKTI